MNDIPDDEIKVTENILKKLEPGFLPLPIFHQVTRLTTTPIVEFVPLRQNDNKIEVLLLKRPNNDPVWPGMLHTPGTVIRATDSLEVAFKRILTKELGGASIEQPSFVTHILHHSGRGMELSLIYWIELTESMSDGVFYDSDEMPDLLVQSQLDFIPAAVENFRKNRH
jgi:ADP-ribose pyrophosphatase YjhB (NUDIX family)